MPATDALDAMLDAAEKRAREAQRLLEILDSPGAGRLANTAFIAAARANVPTLAADNLRLVAFAREVQRLPEQWREIAYALGRGKLGGQACVAILARVADLDAALARALKEAT